MIQSFLSIETIATLILRWKKWSRSYIFKKLNGELLSFKRFLFFNVLFEFLNKNIYKYFIYFKVESRWRAVNIITTVYNLDWRSRRRRGVRCRFPASDSSRSRRQWWHSLLYFGCWIGLTVAYCCSLLSNRVGTRHVQKYPVTRRCC